MLRFCVNCAVGKHVDVLLCLKNLNSFEQGTDKFEKNLDRPVLIILN